MTAIAQGLVKSVAIVKQSALGSPGSTGGQVLRRVTHVPSAARDTYKSNEIIPHQQSTGIAFGLKSVSSKLSGLMSPATYKLLIAAALRADFASLAAYTHMTIAAVNGTGFTDSASGFLTAGFKIGDIIRATGFTAAHNNGRNFLITNLVAGTMTGVFLDGSAVTAEAASNSVSLTLVGKKSKAPLTGQTNDYFSVEDWYSDISKSELFTDMKVSQITVGSPATGNATFAADFLGLGRTAGVAQVLTSPTAATTTNLMSAVNGVLYVNGVVVGVCTGWTLTINANMTKGDAVIGSNVANDIARGIIEVSGSFTALFTDTVLSALYDAESIVSALFLLTDNPAVPTSDFVSFNMGAIKITGDTPDDGAKTIVRTYPFTAQLNGSGGAALANDQTILSVQDSAA